MMLTIDRDLPGIRGIRLLAVDAHREEWLVHVDGESPHPAVLKRARDAEGVRSLRLEAVALHRGAGAGVAALQDVVADHEGIGLLCDYLPGPRLGALIGERERWAAGEVTGVLLPIVHAVVRLHDVGIAMGNLTANSFVVTTNGGVLGGLAGATVFEAGAPEAVRHGVSQVMADRDSIRSIAGDLLTRVEGTRAQAAEQLAAVVEALPPERILSTLSDGLAELAAGVPLAQEEPNQTTSLATHAPRLVPVVREAPAADAPSLHAPAVHDTFERLAKLLRGCRAWLDGLPALRRRALVAGTVAVAVAAVLLAVPGKGATPSVEVSDRLYDAEATDAVPLRPMHRRAQPSSGMPALRWRSQAMTRLRRRLCCLRNARSAFAVSHCSASTALTRWVPQRSRQIARRWWPCTKVPRQR